MSQENVEEHNEDPDSAIHRGLDAVRRQYARWLDSYPDLTVEALEAAGLSK